MRILSYIMIFGLIASLSSAEIFRFTTPNGNWMDGKNWETQNPDGTWKDAGALPRANDRINHCFDGKTIILADDAGTIQKIDIGMGRDKNHLELITNDGANLTVSERGSCIGKNSPGTLTMNGGCILFKEDLNVADLEDGTLLIEGGLIRVEDDFFHNEDRNPGSPTTRLHGGILDVEFMTLNKGVLDIAGGTLRIRAISKEQIQQWSFDGLMTFYGAVGIEGIHYTLSPMENGFEIKAISGVKTVG
jgi:hypothetical protein